MCIYIYIYIYIYTYTHICVYNNIYIYTYVIRLQGLDCVHLYEGGRILLTEMQLPRIARQGALCLISIRGRTRKTRVEQSELDEGFQQYHPPFRIPRWLTSSALYTRSPLEDSRLFGPSPWKILRHYL